MRFPRWFMLAAQAGYTVGLALAYWLLHQAVFDIGAVCPWCLLVTVATTWVFVELTRVNIRDGHLPLPAGVRRVAQHALDARLDVLAAVWHTLITLADYPQWNPDIITAAGTLAAGERLDLTVQLPVGLPRRSGPGSHPSNRTGTWSAWAAAACRASSTAGTASP